MAKAIKVSDDDGSTYYTLPGSQGEFRDEVGVLDDTIFGQNFKSAQTNLINWGLSSNAVYKGFAGYTVSIKKSGTSTSMTGEATTEITSNTAYQVTAATKRVLDPAVAVSVLENGVASDPDDIEYIDYLFGIVKFKGSHTPTEPVTITANYLPLATLAKYRNFTLTMTQEPIEDTDIPAAQANDGHRTHSYGLKTVGVEVSGVYASANGYRAALIARDLLLIEIDPGAAGKAVARGFFKPSSRGQSGNVGELEEENASFALQVPEVALMRTPFRWEFSSSTDISTAVRKCIDAWQNETTLKAQYLPDGTTGLEGTVLVGDVSLSGGLEAMNEFSVALVGTGEVDAVT